MISSLTELECERFNTYSCSKVVVRKEGYIVGVVYLGLLEPACDITRFVDCIFSNTTKDTAKVIVKTESVDKLLRSTTIFNSTNYKEAISQKCMERTIRS